MKSSTAAMAAKTVIRWLRWAAVLALVSSALERTSSTPHCAAGGGGRRPAPLAVVQNLLFMLLFAAQGHGLRRRGREDRATGSPHDGDRSSRCAGSTLSLESRAVAGEPRRTCFASRRRQLHALHPRSLGGRARGGLHFLVGKGSRSRRALPTLDPFPAGREGRIMALHGKKLYEAILRVDGSENGDPLAAVDRRTGTRLLRIGRARLRRVGHSSSLHWARSRRSCPAGACSPLFKGWWWRLPLAGPFSFLFASSRVGRDDHATLSPPRRRRLPPRCSACAHWLSGVTCWRWADRGGPGR